MKATRLTFLVLFVLFVVVSATWAGSRPPANAVLLFRDGSLVIGDVFTVNNRTVSMLTDYGILRYDRNDVSQLVFLEDWNAQVLRAEGYFIDDDTAEGDLFYVGGVWDGRSAGRFTAKASLVPGSGNEDQIFLRTTFDIVRNTMPRGTLEMITVNDGELLPTGRDGYFQDHMAGVIVSGTGDYADCRGTVDIISILDLEGPEKHIEAYFVLRFDAVHP